MLQALKVIGDYSSQTDGKTLLNLLVDDPNDKDVYNTVLVLVFQKQNTLITYLKTDVEEYSRNKLIKYAYKKGSSRGSDYTPTSRVTDVRKTFERIRTSIQKISESLPGTTDDEKTIINLNNYLNNENNQKIIIDDLERVNYSDGAILTIAIEEGEKRSYVGDIPQFTINLISQFEQSLYFRSSYPKSEQEAIGQNNQCYICSEVKEKTYGYVSTFAFYTYDKRGFASGGFNRGKAWKNYPVCPECAYSLEIGKKYLEDHFSARFCGINYYIIPKSIMTEDAESQTEIFSILSDLEEKRKMSLKKDTVERLTGAQDDLFDLMTEYDNFMNFNILFYDSPGGSSEFRILLYVEDVLPSYMRKIFDAKRKVESLSIFRNLPGKENKSFNLNFGFDLIADFFPTDHFMKNFLEITNNIFTGKKISYSMLVNKFMDIIGQKFRQNEPYWYDIRKALAIVFFLNELNLLNTWKEGELRMSIEPKEYEIQFEEFFHQYADFFDSDSKRAIFLEGVLAQKLLNIQRAKREGATPFRERLNGLKLNEKIIKRLLPEMQNKLEEYKANYYQKLEGLISKYLLTCDFSAHSNDEISFYFTVGMNLADEFNFKEKDRGNEDGTD